jgi:riboflavin kinase/FMN adenylyltransferase
MLRGTIIGGKKLGRKLGFPTANMSYDTKYVIPKTGVYYTNIMIDGTLHKSITSVGYNPTVDGKNLSIETYILDFDREIYGQEVKLYFVEYMRDEEKYETLDELVEQLKKDERYASEQELSMLL